MQKNNMIYIDTNCYIDYFEGRVDRLRPLGEFAYNLIRRSIECEFTIVISSLVIDELEFNSYHNQISELIQELKKYNKILYSEEQKSDEINTSLIVKKKKTPFNDTKHAVIANRLGVKYFVTRNFKDFENLNNLVDVVFPENI